MVTFLPITPRQAIEGIAAIVWVVLCCVEVGGGYGEPR